MEEKKTYTVKELIQKLEKIDQSLEVYHEGCDCWGAWNGEIEIKENNYILITRY